jgi:hypothetical protein
MIEKTNLSDGDRITVAQALVSSSTADLFYADRYLDRARTLLSPLCDADEYEAMRRERLRLPQLTSELRQAVNRGAWPQVKALVEQADALRVRTAEANRLYEVAEAVYDPAPLGANATSLALSGVLARGSADLEGARDELLEKLRLLTERDSPWAAFYGARAAYFQELQLHHPERPQSAVDEEQIRRQVIEAVDRGNFAEAKRLTESVGTAGGATGRFRAPRPAQARIQGIAAPFPAHAVDRAREIGLVQEALPLAKSLNEYLSCCCAERAVLPREPIGAANRKSENCTCGHACPPDVRPTLRENLDLLMGRPCISSAGTRYLPWFGPENVLVESFSEENPDERGGLLGFLGLDRRHGLRRAAVEHALLTRGVAACRELGLDSAEFVVTCIPFDVYHRLAPEHAWGKREWWTHLDGYQVTRDLRLWALVGGNARYGGPDDLSILARDYESDRQMARFAVLRRDRFRVRETVGRVATE